MKPSVTLTSTWPKSPLPVGRPLAVTDAHGEASECVVLPAAGIMMMATGEEGMLMLDAKRGVTLHKRRPDFLYAQTTKFMDVYNPLIEAAKKDVCEKNQLLEHLPGAKRPRLAVVPCGTWFHIGTRAQEMWFCANRMHDLQYIDREHFAATFDYARHKLGAEIGHPQLNFALMKRIWQYARDVDTQMLPIWRQLVPIFAPDLATTPRFDSDLTKALTFPDKWIEALSPEAVAQFHQLLLSRFSGDTELVVSDKQLIHELYVLFATWPKEVE